jgi:signal transduction histidine kinase/HAMP domain-containing protein
MTPILSLLSSNAYIEYPQGWVGWSGLAFLLGLTVLLMWWWRKYNRPLGSRQIILLVGLLVFTVAAGLFIGIRLPAGSALTPPGVPVDTQGPAVMLFAAIPWVLAAGLLGPTPAALLAALSGLIYALFESHNPFTPLEMAFLAVLFGAALRQRYRTLFYRLLRHPLVTAFILTLLYPLLYLAVTPFTAQGVLVSRLDYALTNLQSATLAIGIELLIAGLFTEVISLLMASSWAGDEPLVPSPAETSIQTRFMTSLAPLAVILLLSLMVGSWIVAGRVARNMLQARMSNAAFMAAENIPYFLQTGQDLITKLAQEDKRWLSRDLTEVQAALEDNIQRGTFFAQLTVVDEDKRALASHPTRHYIDSQMIADEKDGVDLALSSVPFQQFTIPPAEGQTTAQISFMAAIPNPRGETNRVLIGRANPANNPFTQPSLASLATLDEIEGVGMLLNESQEILVHPDPAMVLTTYTGRTGDEAMFYDDTAPDGTRIIVHYQPTKGQPWAVVMIVPAYQAQQLALSIAGPLLLMILILAMLAFVLLRLSIKVVTASLGNLALEAGRLAQGKLDQPLAVQGEDEVGQLSRSFEQMRISLKARLDELNRLLLVSQGVASSLEISEAVQPVLESALATGGSAARVVLVPTVSPGLNGDAPTPVSFGLGASQNLYSEFDEQILAFTRQQDRLVLPNLTRPRLLNIMPGAARPESLIAVALRHENLYYGALWVAYDQPHIFSEEEVRFLVTLGGQAALAAANAQLFQNAEIGRQRLASILASSPDPVLVTDQRDRLSLANPAAWQALNLGMETDEGQPIQQVISQQELVDLLRSSSDEMQSKEITLPNGQVYLATATQVIWEGQRVGRVCVLRDVTHFKELDALKSDFVSTVGHDLRSPLTLMRGYATMLEMVGQLNEQQIGYVRKIVSGVESMSRLVNNLLDLGRIEAGIGLQLEMIPVQDVIERVVGALQLQAAQKRIQITTEIPPNTTPLIEADQALLQQALHNLVENAIKYTRAEGKVLVRVQVQPIGMVFEVIDNGIGISPMDQPRLFEKFYRGAQQASKDQRGTGLGLAIVRSIAERHGGRVWAESQLGKGSIFRLALPLRQPKTERNK